jgi:predicted site-specific integrase-resolvase
VKLVELSGPKKRKDLKNKINELETNSKNKNITGLYSGINEFKKGYQPRTNMVKEENGDVHADITQYFEYVEEILFPAIICTWG